MTLNHKGYAVKQSVCLLVFVPDRFKTQEICNEAVTYNPYTLTFIPDHVKTQEMRNEVMCIKPGIFSYCWQF